MATREQEERIRSEEEKAEDARREWDALSPEERSKRAVEQNKKIQQQVRDQAQRENEERLQAQRDAVGKEEVTSTRGMTFAEAAEATEKLNQPPNLGNVRELDAERQRATRPAAPPSSTAPAPMPKSEPKK